MKTKLIALTLICALLLGGGCLAEEERPRLDTADRIVYRITNGKYLRACGQGMKNFPAAECTFIRHNAGLVFI